MHKHDTPSCRARTRARAPLLIGLAAAAALGLGACASGTTPTIPAVPTSLPTLPAEMIPTQFPDDLASGPGACIDAPTMAVIDQLRGAASGTDIKGLLQQNRDVLVEGLSTLESSDPAVNDWRDALLTALDSGDFDTAATEIQRLANDEVELTPC